MLNANNTVEPLTFHIVAKGYNIQETHEFKKNAKKSFFVASVFWLALH